jgi:hypothetical protein
MAKVAESRNAEQRLRLARGTGLPPQLHVPCSACQGRIMLDERGEVLFCADCMRRAHDGVEWTDLGGGD